MREMEEYPPIHDVQQRFTNWQTSFLGKDNACDEVETVKGFCYLGNS